MINVLISSENPVRFEHELINEMFEAGLEYFHLRKPDFTEQDFRKYLAEIPELHHNKIIVHQYFEVTESYNIKGLHLPEKIYSELKLRNNISELKNRWGHLSASFHRLDSLQIRDTHLDYVFISPVFPSISKPGYASDLFSNEELKIALDKTDYEVIGLGGMQSKNIETASRMGFSGLAFCGAVWQTEYPLESFQDIDKKIKSLMDK